MADAYKCDVTGKMSEGRGALFADVTIACGAVMRVRVYVHTSPTVREEGVMGQDVVARITKALHAEFGKPEAKAKA